MSATLDAPRFARSVANPSMTAIGEAAQVVYRMVARARWDRQHSAGQRSLDEALADCIRGREVPNWDGEGAKPLSSEVILQACLFIRALPESIVDPEIIPEPDGGIGFEWFARPDLVFVASVKGGGRMVYAGLFGRANTVRGSETFRGLLPQTILAHIRRVTEGPFLRR